jgi:hydroxypyruvate isomerase
MIKTGLTSVTFRKLPAEEIVRLAQQAGLQGIEWGGDVHVPHGSLQLAREVLQRTVDTGLEVSSYGSYYQVGSVDSSIRFETVLDTALALQAKVIRVWAGDRASAAANEAWWDQVIADARRIAAVAAQAGVTLAFEYHEETLTDTSSSTCKLLSTIGCSNFRSYWQPPLHRTHAACLSGLREISPWLSHVHVFHYLAGGLAPLAAGAAEWAQYLEAIQAVPGDRYGLLEFVKGETPGQFLDDAQALTRLCAGRNGADL